MVRILHHLFCHLHTGLVRLLEYPLTLNTVKQHGSRYSLYPGIPPSLLHADFHFLCIPTKNGLSTFTKQYRTLSGKAGHICLRQKKHKETALCMLPRHFPCLKGQDTLHRERGRKGQTCICGFLLCTSCHYFSSYSSS